MLSNIKNEVESKCETECEKENICDKMYGMGSSYKLSERECDLDFLSEKMNSASVSENYKDFANIFTRPDGGYIEQLKRYVNIDLNRYDDSILRNKREKVKLLYFLYKIKGNNDNRNILELLNSQSMENIAFPKHETYNGEIVHNMKEELKKEISRETITKIELFFYDIHRKLDNFLDNTLFKADLCCSYGGNDCAIDYINKKIQKAQRSSTGVPKKYIDCINEYSPIEMMYFRIHQFEYIGQIKDIIFINSIKFDIANIPSLDLIEEMIELTKTNVQIEDIENIIIDEAPIIAKYVYLRDNITLNDIKKIRRQKDKAEQMLRFLYRATPYKDVDNLIDKLHIVSFLQAIILDEKNEVFDYTFYGYQTFMKHKQHVQVSANPNKRPVDALKTYWNRKINDHWYANIGRYEVRCKMRELENACDENMLRLLLEINF